MQDRSIKVWRADDGVLCRTLQGHGHWVNTMALSVDYVLRTGCFDAMNQFKVPDSDEEAQRIALRRYTDATGGRPELLVSGSDDFTLFMWQPASEKKPIARMTGHQQLINQVSLYTLSYAIVFVVGCIQCRYSIDRIGFIRQIDQTMVRSNGQVFGIATRSCTSCLSDCMVGR